MQVFKKEGEEMKKRKCFCNDEDCQVCQDYERYEAHMVDVAKERRFEEKIEQREREQNEKGN